MSGGHTTLKNFSVNFGPQHPAAHGVLRLVVEVNGEVIKKVDPHIGLLHRGTEKLMEYKSYLQGLPYLDRLDYVSMMAQELCYSETIEALLNVEVPVRARLIRTMFAEITRLLNHYLAITTHALDVGALTPFLWGFEEREKLMEFYERVSGARLHSAYIRPGGVSQDIPNGLLDDIKKFVQFSYCRLDEIHSLLSSNRIWLERLVAITFIGLQDVLDFSLSGPLIRAAGLKWDIRHIRPYEEYESLNFSIPVGLYSDCYDRYLVRLEEMYQSLNIISQTVELIEKAENVSSTNNRIFKFFKPDRKSMKNSMEALIHHFKLFTEGFKVPIGSTYVAVEAPKGEFGCFINSIGTSMPHRCKLRAPGFFHLASLSRLVVGHSLSDLVTAIGSLDLVFGEIDR